MRLDKFLKVSRIIKRRTLAKEAVNAGRVMINGKVAKPGTEVKAGDLIEIGFGPKKLTARILDIKESVKADEAKNLYELIEE